MASVNSVRIPGLATGMDTDKHNKRYANWTTK